ncbi:hypothetical protein JOB18_003089 [Solea senegalensis]|uniref:Uncharacterized protein n=1 Tax=Solea senegalensis TaxID=28829 RepID=A0AAV6SIG2_SOLSE|nr:hypothetical protein JOB18_003089 [Solea senegalensis]
MCGRVHNIHIITLRPQKENSLKNKGRSSPLGPAARAPQPATRQQEKSVGGVSEDPGSHAANLLLVDCDQGASGKSNNPGTHPDCTVISCGHKGVNSPLSRSCLHNYYIAFHSPGGSQDCKLLFGCL